MKTFKLLLIPVLILLVWSCEEEFDITAPYQDITVVYGLLDPGTDTVFLKINKAFLGDGDVMEMVKIEDSSRYVNALDAYIEEWGNGSMITSYKMDTMTIDTKEEGTFYNPYQVIYFGPYTPNTDREYHLSVYVNNKKVTATTNLIHNFSISKPSAGSKFIQFRKGTDSEVEWESAKYGKRYEIVIRYKYKEVLYDSPDTVYTHVDWALGTRKSVNDKGGEDMSVPYSNDGFYTFLGDQIPYDDVEKEANVKERYTNDVDFIIAVAALDYNTYMEVNEPSSSIVQERPDYTNVTNGIGLFSSRFRNIRTKKLHPETISVIKSDLPELKFVY
jgi:hypothetical protein